MRLHPAITEAEAYNWLKAQVMEESGVEGEDGEDGELQAALGSFAEAMAAISRTILADELEPLFP